MNVRIARVEKLPHRELYPVALVHLELERHLASANLVQLEPIVLVVYVNPAGLENSVLMIKRLAALAEQDICVSRELKVK